MIYRFQIYIYFVNYFKNHGVMVERRSGEVAVPLSAKKNFKRVVPIDMQTAVSIIPLDFFFDERFWRIMLTNICL